MSACPPASSDACPDNVSTIEGAWVEPTAVALRGVTRSGFKVGRRAVVIGAGPIGLLCVMHLRLGGASHITVLEPSELRRAKAEELGADITIDPLSDDPTEIFGNDIERPDYAFECSAAPPALETAVEILPHHGSLALLGVATFPVSFHSYTIIRKELMVTGSSSYAEEFDISIRLFERGDLDVQPLTSEVVGLEGVLDAFGRLERGEAIKVLVQPDE